MKSAALAAYACRGGEGSARRVVLEELQASKQQARREVETASQLSQVPETLDALNAGEIPEDHAKQIAKAASQGPVDEAVLVEAARREDFGTFSRTLRDHQHEQSPDDGKSLLAKQRKRRELGFFKSPDDGMFILNGRFDPEAGNRIEAALADEVRRQRNDDNAGDQTAFGQRLADALENLVCADVGERTPPRATLILTADWDALNQKLAGARLLDGTPLPVDEALRLACNADIVPAVFNATASNCGWGASTGWPPRPSGPRSSSATSTASAAEDQRCGARPTTSKNGSPAGAPTSTTWCWSANPATTTSTTTAGQCTETETGPTNCDHPPTPTPTSQPASRAQGLNQRTAQTSLLGRHTRDHHTPNPNPAGKPSPMKGSPPGSPKAPNSSC